jgi:16S rRNA (guanine527-N7)-methyltransferase
VNPGSVSSGASFGAEAFAERFDVSRETLDRLTLYLSLLRKWQAAINLVGPRTLDEAWQRHILDSAQLRPLLPEETGRLVDLGSGAGLPGLVLAILGVQNVHLVESDQRKAAFLREAARATGASVTVHAGRIEELPPLQADIVTARALAPLGRLLDLVENHLGSTTECYFLKGKKYEAELIATRKDWTIEARAFKSQTDPSGVILKLWGIRRASHRH